MPEAQKIYRELHTMANPQDGDYLTVYSDGARINIMSPPASIADERRADILIQRDQALDMCDAIYDNLCVTDIPERRKLALEAQVRVLVKRLNNTRAALEDANRIIAESQPVEIVHDEKPVEEEIAW